MLKHVHATASDQSRRSRRSLSNNNNSKSDTCSTYSQSSNTSGSPRHFLTRTLSGNQDFRRSSIYSSPDHHLSMTSRASSFASLNMSHTDTKMTQIKIYAKCLRSDIEYKTLSVSHQTTAAEVIWMLLSKYKMRHRDPKLFYLTMEIGIQPDNRSPSNIFNENSRTLVLEEDSKPAELRSCYPKNDCRFTLQMRKGGLVRIYDSVLMAESKYKCLLISDQTTSSEVINILFHCYGLERLERVDRFAIYEVNTNNMKNAKKLHQDDCPALVQSRWTSPLDLKFVLKREMTVRVCGLNQPLRGPNTPLISLNKPLSGIEVSPPKSTTSSSTSSSSESPSERSLSSCDEHMDESEVSIDMSYNSTSCSSSSTAPSLPSTPEQNSPVKLEPQRTVLPRRLTYNQSVQTNITPNSPHLNTNILYGAFSNVNKLPQLKKNQMSQTSGQYIPLVHKPTSQLQYQKANFNLNFPMPTRPPNVFHPKPQRPVNFGGYDSMTSINESGLPMFGQPTQPQSLLAMKAGTRRPIAVFHDYENYFYI